MIRLVFSSNVCTEFTCGPLILAHTLPVLTRKIPLKLQFEWTCLAFFPILNLRMNCATSWRSWSKKSWMNSCWAWGRALLPGCLTCQQRGPVGSHFHWHHPIRMSSLSSHEAMKAFGPNFIKLFSRKYSVANFTLSQKFVGDQPNSIYTWHFGW